MVGAIQDENKLMGREARRLHGSHASAAEMPETGTIESRDVCQIASNCDPLSLVRKSETQKTFSRKLIACAQTTVCSLAGRIPSCLAALFSFWGPRHSSCSCVPWKHGATAGRNGGRRRPEG
jgi:hypothetical protein